VNATDLKPGTTMARISDLEKGTEALRDLIAAAEERIAGVEAIAGRLLLDLGELRERVFALDGGGPR
jgi:hypothetical protein